MSAPRLLQRLPEPPAGRTGWPWDTETAPPTEATALAWPRITIVIPSYQQAGYLEEALRSVLLQNYPNLELIVNDGGSDDGSAALILRYASFLTHHQSVRDGGQGDAINQGFARATGEILGWLNSDDFYLPGALYSVARAFLSGDPDIVYGDALNLFEADGRYFQYWQAHWIRPEFLHYGGLLASHATFWRRTVHRPIWSELNCNIDGELWRRLLPGRRRQYLPLPLSAYRYHDETKSNAERWRAKWRHDEELIASRHGPSPHSLWLHRWYRLSQWAYRQLMRRRNRRAKLAVLAACRWPPFRWRYSPAP